MSGEERVIQHDVEFGGTGLDGGAGFSELIECILGTFVEAHYAGYKDVRTFEVGDAALDPV